MAPPRPPSDQPSAPNANTAWARVLVDELARAGLRHAVLAPGSRSTPLVLALARHEDVDTHVGLDERSAAFLALGLGKASRRPAAVVTTSGTAAANLHPAIVEARQAEVPLLALTADRPHELRDTDANQTIEQTRLFGDAPCAVHDLSQPKLEPQPLRALRTLADRAVHQATSAPAGPVHLNVPFAKPLEPTPVPDDVPEDLAEQAPLGWNGRAGGQPLTEFPATRTRPGEGTLERLEGLLAEAQRPLLVAGPHPEADRVGPAVLELARRANVPVLADPVSGARFGEGAEEVAVPAYDLFLRSAELREDLEPDLVLRVGRDPTSKHLTSFLEARREAETVVVDAGDTHKDHRAVATRYVDARAAETLEAIADRVDEPSSKAWLARWREAGQRARKAAETQHEAAGFEGTVLREAAQAVPEGGSLFVSNSMPVRDLDAFAPPSEASIQVHANRGASGIDGVTSTAIGLARARESPTLAVLGDLAFLHDRNGLQLLDEDPIVFLVVNNDGGGIFHMLPIRDHEHFDPYFTTPHGLDPASVADTHDLDHRAVDPEEVGPALDEALADPRGQIVEVRTDRERNLDRHQAVEDRVLEEIHGGDVP